MKILVAEDEAIMLALLEKNLRDEGYDVFLANDGQEAIEQLQQQAPDLVITDILMPYTSGMELISYIRSQHPELPIIVLSALGQEATVMEAFKLGADDFITKPFVPAELSLRIQKLLKRR